MPRTLLVIDDNISVRESLRFVLSRLGYDVLLAESGVEALAISRQHHVDGAMIDVNMPGMNGIEVCRVLRQEALLGGRALPVWMITGACSPEVAKLSTDAGALALLGKPFDVADLGRRLEEQFNPAATTGVTPPAPAPAVAEVPVAAPAANLLPPSTAVPTSP